MRVAQRSSRRLHAFSRVAVLMSMITIILCIADAYGDFQGVAIQIQFATAQIRGTWTGR